MSASELGLYPPNPAPTPAARRRLYLYALPFLLLPAILFTAAFLIIPSPWFIARAGNTYLANMDYADTLHNTNCQIIIYGDSTAMTGVVPSIIEHRTGQQTCNLAEYKGVTMVFGTRVLDRYLAHNPPPSTLVFLFAPENMATRTSWHGASTFEAITLILKTQPPATAAATLAAHPLETLSWAEGGMRTALVHARSSPIPELGHHVRDPLKGQLPVTGPAETGCSPIPQPDHPDPTWVTLLRHRYQTPTNLVLVDATPEPTCDPALAHNRQALGPVIDDTPYPAYPVSAFVHGTGHFNDSGSALISNLIADQILSHHSTPAPQAR